MRWNIPHCSLCMKICLCQHFYTHACYCIQILRVEFLWVMSMHFVFFFETPCRFQKRWIIIWKPKICIAGLKRQAGFPTFLSCTFEFLTRTFLDKNFRECSKFMCSLISNCHVQSGNFFSLTSNNVYINWLYLFYISSR